jgi:DNA ligase-1
VTLLADVERASEQVAATPSRLAKVPALADCLRRLEPDEIEIALPYLSGELRQGKLALPYSSPRSATAAAAPSLTIHDVDAAFERLKNTRGKGAAVLRQSRLNELFGKATAEEQDFLVRLVVGELRQGALEGVMLEALAAAAGLPAAQVRRAAMVAGGIAAVERAALAEGAPGLERFAVRLMQPVLPMLAQPAKDARAALAALGAAALEWKLDGARVQVHKSGAEVRVSLPLSVFFFDCLYCGGASLVDRPLAERRRALANEISESNLTPWIVTADPDAADAFYNDALARGHEGIMAKALDAPYEAGRRGASWLKIKRAHTLDLVVIAAEWGHGRRRGRLSNLHLGARDPASGGFVMLGKTFKGMTDAMLEWQTRELLVRELEREEWVVRVRPELVVEIEFSDLQESPQYPAGLALRLARVKRYRTDKRADEADTVDTVRRIYQQSLS